MGRKEGNAVIREFFSSTTCHGLQQVDGATKIRAALWLTAVLATTSFCAYQFINIYVEVKRYEVRVVPELSDEPIPFPAVTVCNLNPFVTSRLERIPQLKAIERISKSVTGGGLADRTETARRKRAAEDLPKKRTKRLITTLLDGLFAGSDVCNGEVSSGQAELMFSGAVCVMHMDGRSTKQQLADEDCAKGGGHLFRTFTQQHLDVAKRMKAKSGMSHVWVSAVEDGTVARGFQNPVGYGSTGSERRFVAMGDWAGVNADHVDQDCVRLDNSRLFDATCTQNSGVLCEFHTPEPCFYELVDPGRLDGQRIFHENQALKFNTTEACQKECDHMGSLCAAIYYFSDSQDCHFHSADSVLRTCANDSLVQSRDTNGQVWVKRCDGETVGCYRREAGRRLDTYDPLLTVASTDGCFSVQRCGDLCAVTPNCKAFHVDKTAMTCQLRSSDGRHSDANFDAYIRTCAWYPTAERTYATCTADSSSHTWEDRKCFVNSPLSGDALDFAAAELACGPNGNLARFFDHAGFNAIKTAMLNLNRPVWLALRQDGSSADPPNQSWYQPIGNPPDDFKKIDYVEFDTTHWAADEPLFVAGDRCAVLLTDGRLHDVACAWRGDPTAPGPVLPLCEYTNPNHCYYEEVPNARYHNIQLGKGHTNDMSLEECLMECEGIQPRCKGINYVNKTDSTKCSLRHTDSEMYTCKSEIGGHPDYGFVKAYERRCDGEKTRDGCFTRHAAKTLSSGDVLVEVVPSSVGCHWVEECQAICNATPNCRAFSFSRDARNCFLYSSTQLFDDPNGRDAYVRDEAACPVLADDGDCRTVYQGYAPADGALRTATTVPLDECPQACAAIKNCNVFRWWSTGRCEAWEWEWEWPRITHIDYDGDNAGTLDCRWRSSEAGCRYSFVPGQRNAGANAWSWAGGFLGDYNASLTACFELCDSTPACLAFRFLSKSQPWCVLFDHDDMTLEDSPDTAPSDFYFRHKTTCGTSTEHCRWDRATGPLTGTQIGWTGSEQTNAHCGWLCEESPDCVAFARRDAGLDCALFASGSELISGFDHVYQRANCDPPAPKALVPTEPCLSSFPHNVQTHADGHTCYFLGQTSTVGSTAEARSACEAKDAGLAVTRTAEVVNGVWAAAQGSEAPPLSLWISLEQRLGISAADDAVHRDWYWTLPSGQKVPMEDLSGMPWGSLDPNGATGERMAVIWRNGDNPVHGDIVDVPFNWSDVGFPLCQQEAILPPCYSAHWNAGVGGTVAEVPSVASVDACGQACDADPFCAAFQIAAAGSSFSCTLLQAIDTDSLTPVNHTDTYIRKYDTGHCWPLTEDNCWNRTGSVIHDGICFAVNDAERHRAAAKVVCETAGGWLAVLRTPEAFTSVVTNGGLSGWLGLGQTAANPSNAGDGWEWEEADGSTSPFDTGSMWGVWGFGQPDDGGGASEAGAENWAVAKDGALSDVDQPIANAICMFLPTPTTTSTSTTSSTTSTTGPSTTTECGASTWTVASGAECWAQCRPLVLRGHCYGRSGGQKPVELKGVACAEGGGHLAVVHTNEDMEHIVQEYADRGVDVEAGYISTTQDSGAESPMSGWRTVWPDGTSSETELNLTAWSTEEQFKDNDLLENGAKDHMMLHKNGLFDRGREATMVKNAHVSW